MKSRFGLGFSKTSRMSRKLSEPLKTVVSPLGKPQVSHAPAGSTRGPKKSAAPAQPTSPSPRLAEPADRPAAPIVPDLIQPPSHAADSDRTVSVSETFTSRQGEGKLTGTPSCFIRTNGCNLRCWFCDTPYASWYPSGQPQPIDSLVQQCRESGLRHVVLTGGEPLMQASATAIVQQLIEADLHVTIETAGTIDKPTACDLLSLSPKLESSAPDAAAHPRWHHLHQQRRMPLDIMRRLIDAAKDFQVKFVVSGADQFAEITACVEALAVDARDVFIMPQGTSIQELDAAAEWLAPWTESRGYHYCDRMQIRWYGNRRGT